MNRSRSSAAASPVLSPGSAPVLSSAPVEPYPLTFFGLFDIPYLPVQGNKAAGELANEGHEIAGKVMIALILLHVAGALKHSIIDKRPSLSRMTFRGPRA